MVNGIRSAQEAYRAETLTYLDVSGSLDNYYPMDTPTNKKWGWGGGNNDKAAKWKMLNVTSDGPVMFGYATIAGPPGALRTPGLALKVDLPEPQEPWYLIQAKGNVDGDDVFSHCVATSFSNEVLWDNEGE